VNEAIEVALERATTGDGRWLPLRDTLAIAAGHDDVSGSTLVWCAACKPNGAPVHCVVRVSDEDVYRRWQRRTG